LSIESNPQNFNDSRVGLKSMVISPDPKNKKSSKLALPIGSSLNKSIGTPQIKKSVMIENDNSNADFEISKIGENINNIEASLQNESNISIVQNKSNISLIKNKTSSNSLTRSKSIIKKVDSKK